MTLAGGACSPENTIDGGGVTSDPFSKESGGNFGTNVTVRILPAVTTSRLAASGAAPGLAEPEDDAAICAARAREAAATSPSVTVPPRT